MPPKLPTSVTPCVASTVSSSSYGQGFLCLPFGYSLLAELISIRCNRAENNDGVNDPPGSKRFYLFGNLPYFTGFGVCVGSIDRLVRAEISDFVR